MQWDASSRRSWPEEANAVGEGVLPLVVNHLSGAERTGQDVSPSRVRYPSTEPAPTG
jgi:hypothetical protein